MLEYLENIPLFIFHLTLSDHNNICIERPSITKPVLPPYEKLELESHDRTRFCQCILYQGGLTTSGARCWFRVKKQLHDTGEFRVLKKKSLFSGWLKINLES